jgi:2'-5' RNA ligase
VSAARVGLGVRTVAAENEAQAAVASEEWRLFIAVPLPPAVREAVAGLVGRLRQVAPEARWQSPDTWHLTLVFLGQTPAREVPRLAEIINGVAASGRPFRTELRGAGSFGGGRRPLVAWIGVGAGAGELAVLAAQLEGAIDPRRESRPLRPHLTVAREAPPRLVEALQASMAARPGLSWTSDRLVLYRSVLGPRGSTHTELVSAPLGGGHR